MRTILLNKQMKFLEIQRQKAFSTVTLVDPHSHTRSKFHTVKSVAHMEAAKYEQITQ